MYFLSHLQWHTIKHHIDDYLQRHFISVIITVVLIMLCIGFNLQSNQNSLDDFLKWVSPSANKIRDGYFWGLLTCNFIEDHPIWLFFSLSWLWTLGRFIENRVSSLFYLWIIISSGVFASLMEIALFESTSYGFPVLTYAMFGFIWVRSISDSSKWSTKPDIVIILILWIVINIALNYTAVYPISVGALFSIFFGFIWAALLAFLETLRNRIGRVAIPLLLLGLCSVPIFWAPWSIDWLNYKASKYYTLKDYDHAKKLSSRILEKDPENEEAKGRLQSIRINEMSEEAYKLYSEGKVSEAQNICSVILMIDSDNEWANKCIKGFTDK